MLPTVVAIPTLRSANSIVEELTMNWVPSTYKSPLILTAPVLSPIPAGSTIIVEGPVIVAVPFETSVKLIPIPVVSNLLLLSKYSSTGPSSLNTIPVSVLAAFLTSNLFVVRIKEPVPVSLI